jgi:hypothetical protein
MVSSEQLRLKLYGHHHLLIKKGNSEARHQWLMPKILATQEDRSSKPDGVSNSEAPILKNPSQKMAGSRSEP